MRSTLAYLSLLGRRDTGNAPNSGLIGRDVILAPGESPKLDRDQIQDILAAFGDLPLIKQVDEEFGRKLIDDARSALNKLSTDVARATLNPGETAALETIVIADGLRPVVNFVAGRLDTAGTKLGNWAEFTASESTKIEKAALSVGRIDLNGVQVGTGFVVSDHEIMTNRHVLKAIAERTETGWTVAEGATISFSDDGDPKSAFALSTHGASAGDSRARTGTEPTFDYAIIPVSGGKLPPPLVLEETRSDVIAGRPVYALGFPGQPQPGTERFSVLKTLFGCEYGIKRYAPGAISAGFRDIEDNPGSTIFGHDCTTLGGSSGSPIIDLGDGSSSVVGIHFAGAKRVTNFAHSMAALQNEFDAIRLNSI